MPVIQKISDKYPKIEEKLTKSAINHLEKFRLFLLVVFLRCSNAALQNPVSAAILA